MSIVPAILVALISAWTAGTGSEEAMDEAVKEQLIAIREMKRVQIEDYFKRIHNQVRVLSSSPLTREAMASFVGSYKDLPEMIPSEQRAALADYYQNQFGRVYREKNASVTNSPLDLLKQVDDVGVGMQYQYIQSNPNPHSSKHLLNAADGAGPYNQAHGRYHPYFRHYLETFGYYDIFLVEPENGRIIYSVFKELDYGTSLRNGPYANSGIAQAFQNALSGRFQDTLVQTDFAPYAPSYDDQAAFIASPITDAGQLIGVLIFQIPIDQINKVMTSDQQWKQVGLGNSGETYLVGPDKTLRNMSRFQIEDPDGYREALRTGGLTPAVVDMIAAKGSGIGLQPVNTAGAAEALSGQSGFDIFPDYRGVPVLSAYSPVKIVGLDWAILSEIDAAEAYGPAQRLFDSILTNAIVITILVIIISCLIGYWFAGSVSRPMLTIARELRHIGDEADLTRKVAIDRKDEIGSMANALNEMQDKFRVALIKIAESSDSVSSSSTELTAITTQSHTSISQQQAETDQLATAMEEMASTAQEIASSTNYASTAASDAQAATEKGRTVVSVTTDSIRRLAQELTASASKVERLKQDSEAIGSVLDVIRGVAEQTNLLALNAAIEAARAGEQGRGFAVVADEVRTLASRTQQSTEEIQKMIEHVQEGADQVAQSMIQSHDQADQGVNQAAKTDTALDAISEAIQRMNEMIYQVASAADEQSTVALQMSRSVQNIAQTGNETLQGADHATQASDSLSQLAVDLKALVNRFRI
ncbi:MAG: methyl-accepting chemotaxis protein [Pseudomonadota bacterium]